jgi:HSP20 family protein
MFVDWYDAGTRASRVPSVWNEMNALLEALERPAHVNPPRLEVSTTDEALTLRLVAPGVSADDIDVSVVGRRLEVNVSREAEVPEGFRALRQERRQWRVQRTLELPFDVRANEAEARLERGVFTLVLPRTAPPEAVKIPVLEMASSRPEQLTDRAESDRNDTEEVDHD